jgi:predicted CoA-binding protein
MPSIAILGASADRSKFGNKAVRAFVARGYDVYPVNPKADEIEGLPAFASLAAIPAHVQLDRISVYLPPAVGMKVLPEIAARGCNELWLNPGSESDELAPKNSGLTSSKPAASSISACHPVSLHSRDHWSRVRLPWR